MIDGVVESPLVSVIVPTRNCAHLVIDAVGSLLNQEYPLDRYEIIVLDDASTGSSVLTLAESHPTHDIRFLRQSAGNQNAARNTGINKARGEFIAFINDDELAPPDWPPGLVAGAARHPEAGCLGGPSAANSRGHPTSAWQLLARRGLVRPSDVKSEVEDVAGGNMVLRAEMIGRQFRPTMRLKAGGRETESMARLRRASGVIVYSRVEVSVGRSHSQAPDFARIPGLLAHAVRRQCSGGLTQAAGFLGYVVETTWRRTTSDRSTL
jgi:Glycosyl transferase family 2